MKSTRIWAPVIENESDFVKTTNFGLLFGGLISFCRSERIVVPTSVVTLQLFSAYGSVTVDVDLSRFSIGRQSSV